MTPGGGLNSRVSNWPTAVFNAMEAFKNDCRCITMDQRNANGGESTGPVPVDNPWDAFADDQLTMKTNPHRILAAKFGEGQVPSIARVNRANTPLGVNFARSSRGRSRSG